MSQENETAEVRSSASDVDDDNEHLISHSPNSSLPISEIACIFSGSSAAQSSTTASGTFATTSTTTVNTSSSNSTATPTLHSSQIQKVGETKKRNKLELALQGMEHSAITRSRRRAIEPPVTPPVAWINPDRTLSIGTPATKNDNTEEEDQEEGVMTGAFVIFSAPPEGPAEELWRSRMKKLFFFFVILDFITIVLLYGDAIQKDRELMALNIVMLLSNVIINIVGIVGVICTQVRTMTAFGILTIFHILISVVHMTMKLQFLCFLLQFVCCYLSDKIRTRLLCQWFSTMSNMDQLGFV